MVASEHQEACALIEAVDRYKTLRPEIGLLYAIPNGGDRHPAVGAKLKREGAKAGIPDYHLPVARGGYHSLYVELKSLTGRASREQIERAKELEAEGNKVVFCRGWAAALDEIMDYLRQPPTAVVRPH